MNRIESFSVDHRYIVPGMYISRQDGDIVTYDLRFKKPNNGKYLTNLEMHSVEHMAATYFRNSEISDRVIYFGPMGCRTGFYLLLRAVDEKTVRKVTDEVFRKIAFEADRMYGQSEEELQRAFLRGRKGMRAGVFGSGGHSENGLCVSDKYE